MDNPDFSVTWDDPADAKLTWMPDRMHFPHPTCQLAAEFRNALFSRYMGARTIFVNHYGFAEPPSPRPPTPEMIERGVLDVWTNDYVPQIQAACTDLRGANYANMTLTALGDALPDIMSRAVVAFGFTMKPIAAFSGPTFDFVAFLQSELGDDGPRLAATMLQGYENGTAAAGAGLADLAEDAATRPAVADALRRRAFDTLDQVDGGSAFLTKFRAYLDEFGWRVDSWGLLDRPTWAENPHVPLTLISHYINDPSRTPRTAHARSVAQREEAVGEVERRLSADKLDAFRSTLDAVRLHVPVSEGRALWQLMILGSLRVPFLAFGHKLADAGALTRADQVFHFTTTELQQAAHNPTADMCKEADAREATFAAAHELTPPPFIGAPPDPAHTPPELLPLLTLFFGVGMPDVQGHEIKGQAASKGVVTGRARVINDLSEADRLQPGEILVCTMTAPPWTPLFAIAAAVVTDTGGVLSHSAICAREYAIPCVVATQVGTQMIKDGSTITVDGTNGIVRLEA